MVVQNKSVLEKLVDEGRETLAAVATDAVSAEGIDGDHQDIRCPHILEQRCSTLPIRADYGGALAGLQQPRLTNSAA